MVWQTHTRVDPGVLLPTYDWYDGTIGTTLLPGGVSMVPRTGAEAPVRVLLAPAGLVLLWSALGVRRPPGPARGAAGAALVVAAVLAVAEATVAPTIAVLTAAVLAAGPSWPGLVARARRLVGARPPGIGGSTLPPAPG